MSEHNEVDTYEDDPGSLEEIIDDDDAEDLKLDDAETKVWLVKVIH
jgi:transcription initiation factor TFIIF subunit beta